MNERYEHEPDWEQLREKVIGLGERSFRKSYYPQLVQQIEALKTERAKAEENEKKFRTLFEYISDGIVLIDRETRLIYLGNPAVSEMLGYSLSELRSRLVEDFLPAEDIPWIWEQFDRQSRREIKIVRDVPARRKDGSLLYVDVNTTEVILEGHILLLCVMRDASERREAEAALEKSHLDTVLALSRMMDARDAYTGNHSQNLAVWARQAAVKLNCSEEEIRTIHWAALLHDIGKIGVPDEILHKPGPLNQAEWQTMKRHAIIGAEIVTPIRRLKGVGEIIRSHHERFDGNGYPDGLKGEAIPLGGRILAVVDAYGAMTDERVYRPPRDEIEAKGEIRSGFGSQFDPRIAQVFLEVLNEEKV